VNPMQEAKFIWMDGKFVKWKDAKVHVLTHALQYGTAVFEGIRCYKTDKGPAIFKLHDHLTRLKDSAHILGFGFPHSVDELKKVVVKLVAKNGLKECYIRPLVYLPYGKMGLNIVGMKPKTMVAAFPWDAYLGKTGEEKGIRAKVSSFLRPQVDSTMNDAKTAGNYVNSVLAKQEAVQSGFDEAIMLDANGYVAEASAENIFIFRHGSLWTPPTSIALEGMTRKTVFDLVNAGIVNAFIKEEVFTRDDVYSADECFLTGTAAEITPVVEVDNRKIGSGKPGNYTKQLQQAYRDVTHGKVKQFLDWLTFVK